MLITHILLRNSATLIRPSNLAKTSQRPQTSMRCQMLFHFHSVLKLTIKPNPQSELARCVTGSPGERQRASLSCCDYAYLPSRITVLSTAVSFPLCFKTHHNTHPSKRAGALRNREPGRASASFLLSCCYYAYLPSRITVLSTE